MRDYAYLKVPPVPEMRSCVGLVLAGMATRARVGVGGLDEAVEILESLHTGESATVYRFSQKDERVIAEVEEPANEAGGETRWRTVVELLS
jgi:hypothetical protein